MAMMRLAKLSVVAVASAARVDEETAPAMASAMNSMLGEEQKIHAIADLGRQTLAKIAAHALQDPAQGEDAAEAAQESGEQEEGESAPAATAQQQQKVVAAEQEAEVEELTAEEASKQQVMAQKVSARRMAVAKRLAHRAKDEKDYMEKSAADAKKAEENADVAKMVTAKAVVDQQAKSVEQKMFAEEWVTFDTQAKEQKTVTDEKSRVYNMIRTNSMQADSQKSFADELTAKKKEIVTEWTARDTKERAEIAKLEAAETEAHDAATAVQTAYHGLEAKMVAGKLNAKNKADAAFIATKVAERRIQEDLEAADRAVVLSTEASTAKALEEKLVEKAKMAAQKEASMESIIKAMDASVQSAKANLVAAKASAAAQKAATIIAGLR